MERKDAKHLAIVRFDLVWKVTNPDIVDQLARYVLSGLRSP